MSSYAEIARSMEESLILRKPPIAIRFSDHVPEGIPSIDGRVPAGCVFWEKAAASTFATSAPDHDLCSIGVYTHNLQDPSPNHESELQTVVKVLGDVEYLREADLALVPVLNRRPKYVIYGPLAETSGVPDAVMLFVDSRQSLIVTEAAQQVELGIAPAIGRPACGAIPQAVNSGRAALSLGCCGARAYLDGLTDDVALWVLPGNKVGPYAERIASLSKSNHLLTQFHQLRRKDVEEGGNPTYSESLARLQP